MDTEAVCRTCLRDLGQNSVSLTKTFFTTNGGSLGISYLEALRQCTKFHMPVLALNDGSIFQFPTNICLRCSKALCVMYHFSKLIDESEEKLKQLELDELQANSISVEFQQWDGCNDDSGDSSIITENVFQTETESSATTDTDFQFESDAETDSNMLTEDSSTYLLFEKVDLLDKSNSWLHKNLNHSEVQEVMHNLEAAEIEGNCVTDETAFHVGVQAKEYSTGNEVDTVIKDETDIQDEANIKGNSASSEDLEIDIWDVTNIEDDKKINTGIAGWTEFQVELEAKTHSNQSEEILTGDWDANKIDLDKKGNKFQEIDSGMLTEDEFVNYILESCDSLDNASTSHDVREVLDEGIAKSQSKAMHNLNAPNFAMDCVTEVKYAADANKLMILDIPDTTNAALHSVTSLALDFEKCTSAHDLNVVRNNVSALKESRTFEKEASEDEEQVKDTSKEVVREHCSAAFTDVGAFIRHVNHHKGITPFRCNICNYSTCYAESLRKHYKKMHNVDATNDIVDTPIDPFVAPMEKPYHEVIYTCNYCSYYTHECTEVKVHIGNVHSVADDLDDYFSETYNCPDCHRQFKDRKSMRAHFTLTHIAVQKSSSELYACENCAKQFQFRNSLSAHERVCCSRNNVSCHICTEKFSTLNKFEQHLRRNHAVATIHECEVCYKVFMNAKALSLHRKRHTERHFHCDICPRSYVNSTELQTHIERVHSTDLNKVCRICNMAFSHASLLRQHEIKEHNQILYKCAFCDFQAAQRSSVRVHEFVHTGKPYKCDICGRKFAVRDLMRKHAKNVHSIILTDEQLAAMFHAHFGYYSRYDSFSQKNCSLEIMDVTEEDIEKELQELGLNLNDMMKELFSDDNNNLKRD